MGFWVSDGCSDGLIEEGTKETETENTGEEVRVGDAL